MNERHFRRLFPNASDSTVAANCEIRSAGPQREQVETLDAPSEGAEASVQRPLVRFTMCRKGLLDPDAVSFACKDLLDGLRHARLIKDDSEKEIDLRVGQRLVRANEEPHTVIEITYETGTT